MLLWQPMQMTTYAVVYNSRDSREAANGLQQYINALPAWCKRWILKKTHRKQEIHASH